MLQYHYSDQVSIASSQTNIQHVFPRSTSTSELYAYPELSQRKNSIPRNINHGIPKSNSSTSLQLIPEHKPQHRLTPYQIQRNNMRESFQFPNGENFTPRNRLPKSSSAISLSKHRTSNPGSRVSPIPRSASMVSTALPPQRSCQRELLIHGQQLPVHHMQARYNSTTCYKNESSNSSHLGNPKISKSSPQIATTKSVRQLPLPSSSVSLSNPIGLGHNVSQVSVTSSINRQTSSSNDSRSTTVSMRDAGPPSSATSTEISVDEPLKGISTNFVKKQSSLVANSIKEPTKIPLKRSRFSLGILVKKILPFNKKSKQSTALQPQAMSKVPSKSNRREPGKNCLQSPGVSNGTPKTSKKPTTLILESQEDLSKDESINDLMDIDLVFDTLLLKSERQQTDSPTQLVEVFNIHSKKNNMVVEPPPRSSKRPQTIKDINGPGSGPDNKLDLDSEDRILTHLFQSFKFVHLNSTLPTTFVESPTNTYPNVKKCRFNDEVYVNDTFSPSEYMRSDRRFLESRKQLMKTKYVERIKSELNDFKRTEMPINPASVSNTHFFPEMI